MSRSFIWVLYLSVFFPFFASCAEPAADAFRLEGVWTLQSVRMSETQGSFSYPDGAGRTPVRIFSDSTFYAGHLQSSPSGLVLRSAYQSDYTLVARGDGQYAFFEGRDPFSLQVLDDSTLLIQDFGRDYLWRRLYRHTGVSAADLASVVSPDASDWGDPPHNYVFSAVEQDLRSANHTLYLLLLLILTLLAFLSYYVYTVVRRKQHVEQQLHQIQAELSARPQQIRQAMQSVEQEFLHSDYYISFRRRIAEGTPLRSTDWETLEQQLNGVYPGFVARLYNLCALSATELQICILIKLNVSPTDIARVLCKEVSSISSARMRLYTKVFSRKGSARDWDDFIHSL